MERKRVTMANPTATPNGKRTKSGLIEETAIEVAEVTIVVKATNVKEAKTTTATTTVVEGTMVTVEAAVANDTMGTATGINPTNNAASLICSNKCSK